MKSPPRPLFAATALLAAAACGGSDRGPTEISGGPGTVVASLESPNGPEGGALIHLIQNGARNVSAAEGDLFTSVAGDTVKVLLLREQPGDLVFRFDVPDTTRLPEVRIVEVTDGANALRDGLGAYTLRMGR